MIVIFLVIIGFSLLIAKLTYDVKKKKKNEIDINILEDDYFNIY
jgi:hypothetical protein